MRKFFYTALLVLAKLFAQGQPFAEDIAAFKKSDSIYFPAVGQVLFVGSSSFTMWKDMQDYFPGHKILNRAFGGSTLADVIYYANDVILQYQPEQIVIYCGENDLAYADTITPQIVYQRFQHLFSIIRKKYPSVPVLYVSLKPSPSRKHLWTKMKQTNRLIKSYLQKKKKTVFVDVWPEMFNNDGTIKSEIFIEDNLHMNAAGYKIWAKKIEPYLVK